tara:strand:+ start:269 stop:445 length:177 start_codon:yes stop_codon:yes gene_type:complete
MKKAIITLTTFASLFAFTQAAYADVYVNGYWKQNGTYVDSYYRTAPNDSIYDNYSYWD